jgi:hypothetical protein
VSSSPGGTGVGVGVVVVVEVVVEDGVGVVISVSEGSGLGWQVGSQAGVGAVQEVKLRNKTKPNTRIGIAFRIYRKWKLFNRPS